VSRHAAGLGHRLCRTAAEPISVATLGAVVGAALLACSSAIHLHLWWDGYRSIPTIGPLFLVQGIVGIALAVGVVVLRRPCALAGGALFALGTKRSPQEPWRWRQPWWSGLAGRKLTVEGRSTSRPGRQP
jgi:hypothetical protein